VRTKCVSITDAGPPYLCRPGANLPHFSTAGQKCDEFGRNPRKGELNLENKRCNDEIESIKRRLNEEDAILASLREVAETQNTIDILQEQCGKDLVSLKESIQDESSTFLRFNIESPKDLPSDGDADGDKLIERVGKIGE